MAATATLRDPLLPRQPGGMAGGAALAIGVHVALVVALAAAVNWRTQTVDVVASAELWAAVPQMAAPPTAVPPPAPAPAPVVATPAPARVPAPTPAPAAAPEAPRARPDIALERERERNEREQREQREQREAAAAKAKAADAATNKAADAAKVKAADAARATAAVEEAKLAAQRAENLRRMMGQAGGASASAPPSTGSAARDAAPSTAYIGRLVATIRTNIVFTSSPPGNPTAEVEVRAGPSGTILSRRLVKPSGVAEWDEAVLRAIDRTAALPRDSDGRVPPVLLVAFRLRE